MGDVGGGWLPIHTGARAAGRPVGCCVCALHVFLLASVPVDAVFFVYLIMFLVDKIQPSKHKIGIQLQLFPDVAIVSKHICIIKMSLVSELAVSKVLALSLASSKHSVLFFLSIFLS